MMRKPLLALLLAFSLPLLAVTVPAQPPPPAVCKTLSGGITACGYAEVVGCGAGAASGEATSSVDWHLHVRTNHGDAHDYHTGHAAALAATGPCWTDTCTQALLYANGELVHASMIYCIQI